MERSLLAAQSGGKDWSIEQRSSPTMMTEIMLLQFRRAEPVQATFHRGRFPACQMIAKSPYPAPRKPLVISTPGKLDVLELLPAPRPLPFGSPSAFCPSLGA